MIAYLQGTILDVTPDECIVLTGGGVGYQVRLVGAVSRSLPQRGAEAVLFVKTVIREDALDLYGFATSEEREAFETLLSVSKLGPKTATAILGAFDPAGLSDVVLREDVRSLSRVHGIGPKSAKRILWELKDRFSFQPGSRAGSALTIPDGPVSAFADALAALTGLGYGEAEVRSLVAQILEEAPDLTAGEIVRATLKHMAKSRP